jgi:hypothetical protein
VTIPENGQTILHQVGQGGTLRIDKPAANTPPPPPAAPAVAKTETPAAAPAPAEKPLSRLEQLRKRK